MISFTVFSVLSLLLWVAVFERDSQFTSRYPEGHVGPSDRYFDIPDLITTQIPPLWKRQSYQLEWCESYQNV